MDRGLLTPEQPQACLDWAPGGRSGESLWGGVTGGLEIAAVPSLL